MKILKDSTGIAQRIRADSASQARYALAAINAWNATQPDGGRAVAKSWAAVKRARKVRARVATT